MAGYARYTALLDACVLHPLTMADALISLASTGLYAAKWTRSIEDEWIVSVEERRPDLKGRLAYRRDQMREAVPDWEIDEKAWRTLTPGLSLPDVDDVHVLAAALAGHADCIVTANVRDFPIEVVAPLGVEIIHPDQFIIAVGSRSTDRRCCVQAHAGALEKAASDSGGLCGGDREEWDARHRAEVTRGR